MSKLGDFLKKHKVDPRRVVAVSRRLEALQPEDRVIRMARQRAKGGDDGAKELASKKPRSGRPVSKPALDRALVGKTLPRRARARVLRAVNAVLAHKSKGSEAKSSDLF
jgi:hypothetical protein